MKSFTGISLMPLRLFIALSVGSGSYTAEWSEVANTASIPSGAYTTLTSIRIANQQISPNSDVRLFVDSPVSAIIEPSFTCSGNFSLTSTPIFVFEPEPVNVTSLTFYTTARYAATAAIHAIWGNTLSERREYGGAVYRVTDNVYGFTSTRGEEHSISRIPGNPQGTQLIGVWHTHWDQTNTGHLSGNDLYFWIDEGGRRNIRENILQFLGSNTTRGEDNAEISEWKFGRNPFKINIEHIDSGLPARISAHSRILYLDEDGNLIIPNN